MNAAAGVLFHSGDGRILLVQPSYKRHWDLPGGVVERGESPKAAAAREVKEELGVTVEPGRLLIVDYLPQHGNRPEMVAYIFEGGYLSDTTITVDGSEILAWAWCTGYERLMHTATAPILGRRIEHAEVARRQRVTLYLENGWAQ